jgi:aspartate/methionine/tyrosine aminotransferase
VIAELVAEGKMLGMATTSPTSIPVADRVHNFTYAIRNIVAEAKAVEAAGKTVRYLNIGDPIPFGFPTPPVLVEIVTKAMRDGVLHAAHPRQHLAARAARDDGAARRSG